jgi:cytochrome c biogenesis protein CcmG/thiol:disulfide interchange protein DsbE
MGQISFKIILVIPFFILLCLSLFVFYGYDIEFVNGKLSIKSNISKQIKSNLIGSKRPSFYVTSLGNYEAPQEKHLDIADYKLVNFWASWCAPCRAEHTALMSIQKNGYRIIGVNYKDSPSNAEKFISELGNPYISIGSDSSGKTAINWGVYGIPETFLLDKENKILLRIAGPITRAVYDSQLKDYLEQ